VAAAAAARELQERRLMAQESVELVELLMEKLM
jgi:hypothetical protein